MAKIVSLKKPVKLKQPVKMNQPMRLNGVGNEFLNELERSVKLAFKIVTVGVGYCPAKAHEIIQNRRYENDPETIFYNSSKPTPNTIDFPNGEPTATTTRLYNWLDTNFS